MKIIFAKLERKRSNETEGLQGMDVQGIPCGPGISML